MRVFRIAKRQYINDLTGEGARLYGGRWNRKGTNVLYTSESRSLATVEYLVHLPLAAMPNDVCIAEIEIPDRLLIQTIEIVRLPTNWTKYPAIAELSEIGLSWHTESKFPILKVPSAVVKNEWNYLLNPEHRQYSEIRLISVEDYDFDQRLLRRGKI